MMPCFRPHQLFLDLDHIRLTQNVVTTAEFLRLHGASESVETTTGRFDRPAYLPATANLSVATVSGDTYDKNVSRVDRMLADQYPLHDVEALEAQTARDVRAWFAEKDERARKWEDLQREFQAEGETQNVFGSRMRGVGVEALESFAGP